MFKSLVLGRPIAAEILVERIPLEDIPEDSDKISNWLHENYQHKVLGFRIVINSSFVPLNFFVIFNIIFFLNKTFHLLFFFPYLL